jgi:hypothetical protein
MTMDRNNAKVLLNEHEMGRACNTDERAEKYKVLVGKPKRKRPLERP